MVLVLMVGPTVACRLGIWLSARVHAPAVCVRSINPSDLPEWWGESPRSPPSFRAATKISSDARFKKTAYGIGIPVVFGRKLQLACESRTGRLNVVD